MNRDNDKGKVLIRRSLIMALGKFFFAAGDCRTALLPAGVSGRPL